MRKQPWQFQTHPQPKKPNEISLHRQRINSVLESITLKDILDELSDRNIIQADFIEQVAERVHNKMTATSNQLARPIRKKWNEPR
ncbi:hypothetical protein pb186bvf_016389 [Paramecium bursaria]